jgi:hypothetical protein
MQWHQRICSIALVEILIFLLGPNLQYIKLDADLMSFDRGQGAASLDRGK